MIGPVKAEVVAELIELVNADFTRAVKQIQVNCPDCGGHGDISRREGDEVIVNHCSTCNGSGTVEVDDIVIKDIPNDLRPHITDFKIGRGGKIMPVFKSKDKAIVNLIAVLGLNKQVLEVTRTSYGEDMTDEQIQAEAAALRKQLGLPNPPAVGCEEDE